MHLRSVLAFFLVIALILGSSASSATPLAQAQASGSSIVGPSVRAIPVKGVQTEPRVSTSLAPDTPATTTTAAYQTFTQTDWSGGGGQQNWGQDNRFWSSTNIDYTTITGQISLVSGTTSGELVSSVYDAGALADWLAVRLDRDALATGATLSFQVRTGDVTPPDASWSAWQEAFTFIPTYLNNRRYVQYKVVMDRTNAGISSPILKEVIIRYDQPPALDWPVYRANLQRTGYLVNRSDLTDPYDAWSYYTGGTLGGDEVLVDDVNGDGSQEIVMLIGGRVLAKSASGAVLWTSEIVGYGWVVGVYDLDGNGIQDIVVLTGSPARLWILHGESGAVQWSKQDFMVGGDVTAKVVADLTGDGLPEMVIWDYSRVPVTHRAVRLFTFAGGVENATQVWAWQESTYESSGIITSGDVDGDGQQEIVVEASEGYDLRVHDGSTGALQATASTPFGSKGLYLRNVDGDAALEIISIHDGRYGDSYWGRQIAVYDATSTTINVKWKMYDDRDDVSISQPLDNSVADLDGNGDYEIITGVYNHTAGEEMWRTLIWQANASTPTILVNQPGEYPIGVLDMDGDSLPELLTAQSSTHAFPAFSIVTAYDYSGGNLAEKWSTQQAARAGLFYRPGPTTSIRRVGLASLAAQNLDGDSQLEVYLQVDTNGDGVAEQLNVYDGSTGNLDRSYVIPADTAIGTLFTGPLRAPGNADTLLNSNDGYLDVLDSAFVLQASRIQTGGFQTDLLISDVNDDGQQSLLILNSQGQFLNLGVGADTHMEPPTLIWTIPISAHQAVKLVADLDSDGQQEFVVFETASPATPTLKVLEADGHTVRWSHPFAAPFSECQVAAGNIDGVGSLDLFVQVVDHLEIDTNLLLALSGDSGALLWEQYGVVQYAMRNVSVVDATRDGVDDLASAGIGNDVGVFDGTDGTLLWTADGLIDSGTPFVATMVNLDGDASAEMVTGGQAYWTNAFELAPASPKWQAAAGSNRAPAVVDADGNGDFELGYWNNTNALTVREGVDGSVVWEEGLYNGTIVSVAEGIYHPPTAAAATDIDGDGRPELLLGGEDGYLYAVNAEDGSLAWTHNFGYPVNEPIVADIDGDGKVEILVSVADGYVHALDQQPTWQILVYLDGDNDLAGAVWPVVEALTAASATAADVEALVLWDGNEAGDSALYHIAGGLRAELTASWLDSEVNLGDPQTLIDFVQWARANHPADHTFLSILDHGGGWSPTIEVGDRLDSGLAPDVLFPSLDHYRFKGGTGLAWDYHTGTGDSDYLSTAETRDALATATGNGAQPIDVLFYDACLMGMLEETHGLAPYVRYFVASENESWASVPYRDYLQVIGPTTTPAQLATAIVEAYAASLQAEGADNYPYTLAALDLSHMDEVSAAFGALAQRLSERVGDATLQAQVQAAYAAAQKLDSDSDLVLEADREGYVDLYDLALGLAMWVTDTAVVDAANDLAAAWDAGLVVAEVHHSGTAWNSGEYWDLDGAHGLSVYVPFGEELTMVITHTNGLTEVVPIRSLYGPDEAPAMEWRTFVNDYVAAVGPLPVNWIDGPRPGLLPMKETIYLPLVLKNHDG